MAGRLGAKWSFNLPVRSRRPEFGYTRKKLHEYTLPTLAAVSALDGTHRRSKICFEFLRVVNETCLLFDAGNLSNSSTNTNV